MSLISLRHLLSLIVLFSISCFLFITLAADEREDLDQQTQASSFVDSTYEFASEDTPILNPDSKKTKNCSHWGLSHWFSGISEYLSACFCCRYQESTDGAYVHDYEHTYLCTNERGDVSRKTHKNTFETDCFLDYSNGKDTECLWCCFPCYGLAHLCCLPCACFAVSKKEKTHIKHIDYTSIVPTNTSSSSSGSGYSSGGVQNQPVYGGRRDEGNQAISNNNRAREAQEWNEYRRSQDRAAEQRQREAQQAIAKAHNKI
jgi:hypothetical protein